MKRGVISELTGLWSSSLDSETALNEICWEKQRSQASIRARNKWGSFLLIHDGDC